MSEGTAKTYSITTTDGSAIKRAILADGMALALMAFDEQLRQVIKYDPNCFRQTQAEDWRDELRATLHDNGICLDDLYE